MDAMTDPFSGTPNSIGGGLLQSPSNYSYPLTSGLLSGLSQPQTQTSIPQGGPWSQLAYQMAGSPKQGGMYASVAAPPAVAGSSSSSSSLASLLPLIGGLLGGTAASGTGGLAVALKGVLGGSTSNSTASTNALMSLLSGAGLTNSSSNGYGSLDNPNYLFNQPGYNAVTGDTDTSDIWANPFGNSTTPSTPNYDFNDPFAGATYDSGSNLDSLLGSFNGAGGQAATPTQSSLNFGQIANAGLSGLGLANSAATGNGIGIAGNAASLANSLGVPSSITAPVSTGAGLAGMGMQAASGNYLGLLGSLLGLGGKAAGIPSGVGQALGLGMSAATGNPVGIAVNAAKILSGLNNVVNNNVNYDGSWAGSSATGLLNKDANAANDQVAAGIPGLIAQNQAAITGQQPAAQPASTFTPGQLQNISQQTSQNALLNNLNFFNTGSYAGQPINMMNQGEAETPVDPFGPEAAMQLMMYGSNPYANLS